jgi:hypothetical protein
LADLEAAACDGSKVDFTRALAAASALGAPADALSRFKRVWEDRSACVAAAVRGAAQKKPFCDALMADSEQQVWSWYVCGSFIFSLVCPGYPITATNPSLQNSIILNVAELYRTRLSNLSRCEFDKFMRFYSPLYVAQNEGYNVDGLLVIVLLNRSSCARAWRINAICRFYDRHVAALRYNT